MTWSNDELPPQCKFPCPAMPKIKSENKKKNFPPFLDKFSKIFFFFFSSQLHIQTRFALLSLWLCSFRFNLSIFLTFVSAEFASMLETTSPSTTFLAVRFLLFGFDPIKEREVSLSIPEIVVLLFPFLSISFWIKDDVLIIVTIFNLTICVGSSQAS